MPWLFTGRVARPDDLEQYERLFRVFSRRLQCMLRENNRLDPNVIVAPELGLMSASELALLWIQRQHKIRLSNPDPITQLPKSAQARHKIWLRKKNTHQKRVRRAAIREEFQTALAAKRCDQVIQIHLATPKNKVQIKTETVP